MLLPIILLTFIAVTLLIMLFFPRVIFAEKGEHEIEGSEFIYQIKPILTSMAKTNAKIELKGYKEGLEKKMIAGGDPLGLTPDEFISFCELSAVAGIIVICLPLGFSLSSVLFGVIFGFFLPNMWLNDTVKKRKHQITRQLPDFLDVLTLTVEAGLDFGAALRKVISVTKRSALVDEFKITMQEMKLGTTRYDALKNMATRVDIPDVGAFISSLLQADQLGTSLGPTLRIQADQMRVKRMQKAEKAGGEASVKLLVPLMLFIFPAVFIMLFGPIVIKVVTGGI